MINIEENKIKFIELIQSISRPGFRKDEFLAMLESSNFYTSPASTIYHNDVPGGLCDHCLKVYYNLVNLAQMKGLYFQDPDTLIIAALFHDMSKINFYTIAHKNVKVYATDEEYNANPKAFRAKDVDEGGHFRWGVEDYYTTIDKTNRFIYGNHEMTCEYLASCYIPLTREESVAILHHMGSLGTDSVKDDIFTVYRTYPLALLLFEADLMASTLDEVVV